jgi:hypothetical protein
MDDITLLFDDLLKSYGSVDIAEAEFKRMINDDQDLRDEYRNWCDEVGFSEKRGFLDYFEEYMETQDSIWDNLNDYDE